MNRWCFQKGCLAYPVYWCSWEWCFIGEIHQTHTWSSCLITPEIGHQACTQARCLTSPNSDVPLGRLIMHVPGLTVWLFCRVVCHLGDSSSTCQCKVSDFPKSSHIALTGTSIPISPRVASHWRETLSTYTSCPTSKEWSLSTYSDKLYKFSWEWSLSKYTGKLSDFPKSVVSKGNSLNMYPGKLFSLTWEWSWSTCQESFPTSPKSGYWTNTQISCPTSPKHVVSLGILIELLPRQVVWFS